MSIAAAIQSLHDVNPNAVRLAESVSFAVLIDRAFLRTVRLALAPPADAGAEADLWFSALVQSRTADGIVFHPEAADALRRRMTAQQVEDVWRLTSAAHTWLAPSLQLEERIAYLSVSKEPTASEDLAMCLRSVLAAMVSGERAGLAQWAVRALAMFPSRVQALPEARMLETGTRMRLGDAIAAPSEDQPLPAWMPWIAPASLGTVSLEFELRDGELEIRTMTQDLPVKVPKTNPLILEVSWPGQTRQITFRDKVTVPVGSRELTLRTITGEEFDLHETGQGTFRLRLEIVDFSREMEMHREVVGRQKEIAEIFAEIENFPKIAVTGEVGFGKTAFLCELIREAERRGIPTVAHFFRFGDLRMESVEAAQRSLSAQIAVKFGMDERVLDLRLGEVLERLQSQTLLIVIDDIDQARDANRSLFPGAWQEMFLALPDGVTVVCSSLHENADNAPYVFPLDDRLIQPPSVASIKSALDSDVRLRLAVVALRPLPVAILNPIPEPFRMFLRIENDEFLIADDVIRERATEALGADTVAESHRALVDALAEGRDYDNKFLYHLTNAVWHLVQSGDMDAARELAMRVWFMITKIEMFGVRPLIADFRMLEHTPLTNLVMLALNDYESELVASPRDLAAILHTATLGAGLPPPDLPLLPQLIRKIDTSVRRPRKHDGPIRGSRLIVDPVETNIADPMIVTWSDDGTATLWALSIGDDKTLSVGAPVTAFQVTWPHAIAADAKGFLDLWRIDGPWVRAAHVRAHDRAIDGMLFDPVGNLIVTWAGSDPIRLWTLNQAGESIASYGELQAHSSAVVGCAFMRNELLVSASRGGTCRLWSVNSRRELGSGALWGATGMAFHWDASSRFILTGKRTLDVVQVAQSSLTVSLQSIDTGHELPVTGVAVSPDGQFVATWSDDQTIRLWTPPMRSATRILRGHQAAITACRFHEDRSWLISADAEGIAIVWDRESGGIVCRFDRHIRAIRTIEIDGIWIFTGGDDGIVLAWDGTSGDVVRDFSKPEGRIEQCVVLPGDDLAVLISDGESEIRTGDFEGALQITRPLLATSRKDVLVCAADASNATYFTDAQTRLIPLPDVPHIAACAVTDDSYFAIATRDGRVFAVGPDFYWQELVDDSPTTHLAFATNRILVSTSIDRTLSIWDRERGERIHRLDAHRSRILALAALENTAVTGSADGTLRIWDVRTGSAQTIEAAHAGPITGLWLEGNIVVSASLDRTIRVFDYKLAKELAVCRGHRDRITGVAIAMTDEVLYSCSDDRTIRQWDIETGEQKAIAYGTAPFRCISWRDGKLAAGDDAGNLWTVKQSVRGEERTRIYICHSRSDMELAERLGRDLAKARIDAEIRPRWVDQAPPSVAFSAIEHASLVIVIVSPASIDSTAVRQEVDQAIRAKKRTLFLTSASNRFDVLNRWPELGSLQSIKVTDWRDEESYRAAVDQLIGAIQGTTA
jgi:WD40 repeat protein